MKVKELIKILKKVDQNFEVILSSDSEGNSYSPVCDCSEAEYGKDNNYPEVVFENDINEDEEYDFEANSIVLIPTN